MSVPELTVAQLREYYRETLSGDGVCTVTEDKITRALIDRFDTEIIIKKSDSVHRL